MRLLLLAALAALMLASTATASPWKPGTNLLVSEEDMGDLLEMAYDTAYCSGIPRFGHSGEFPYEEFIVFDCTVKINGTICSDRRYRAIKASKRFYYKAKLMRPGSCY